ncbi:MAG: DUF1579 domain-containing protein [Thermoanaerobaculia bacterium]
MTGRAPRLATIVWLLVVGLVAAGPAVTLAQETDPSDPPGEEVPVDDPTPESPRSRLAALGAPGKFHEYLAAGVGSWELTIQVWRTPDSEPVVSAGNAEAHWILGNRFVETSYQGEILGHPFEARSVEGYDNHAKEYVSTWRDTMGTYTMSFRGGCDEDCLVRTVSAEITDPVSGQKLTNKRVTTVVDENSYTYESFIVTPSGAEFKNMELIAQRRAQ